MGFKKQKKAIGIYSGVTANSPIVCSFKKYFADSAEAGENKQTKIVALKWQLLGPCCQHKLWLFQRSSYEAIKWGLWAECYNLPNGNIDPPSAQNWLNVHGSQWQWKCLGHAGLGRARKQGITGPSQACSAFFFKKGCFWSENNYRYKIKTDSDRKDL